MNTIKQIMVTKLDGRKEPLDIDKIHRCVTWACEGLSDVSVSELEIKSQLSFFNNIKTKEIQETLIKAASELITEETSDYQYVAGRLINFALRKEVYKQYEPIHILELVKRNVKLGLYDKNLLKYYTEEEWNVLNSYLKHDRDLEFTYVAMEQFRGKYLVQNRITKQIYETPQMLYMLVGATLFNSYPKETRLKYVREFYESASKHDISLPTPIMSGVRTQQKQFSSCVLIESDDSIDSINATASSIVKYVSQKAGIGINAGRIRALGSKIRSGDAFHTGCIPFYKYFQAAVKSCNQGGVRGGAATLYYPVWHYEFEELIVLKNNKGTEENRVRHMDYGVQFNKLMYERLITGGNITLFSPSDVPGLYDAFFNDQDKFKELYEAAEANPRIRKKTLKAIDVFSMFMTERKDTGRIYLMNVDHCNTHSSYDETIWPVHQSNLCCEITLPTDPVKQDQGLIALCTLGAINWGNIKKPSDFEKPCEILVRALDALLDYQDYPLEAAQRHTKMFRPLGNGIINFAYFLAKHNVKYSDGSALELVDEYAEAWSYYLIKASVKLAKEFGPAEYYRDSKYGQGKFPFDTRKRDVDFLVEPKERMDWETLANDMLHYGIRNTTLMAIMPAETSAQISNSTNGIEPPRSYISIKQSKDGVLKQVVPEFKKLKNKYELLWDQKSPEGYLKICAVIQKYVDQAISVNTSYNPLHYPDQKIPMSEMLQHVLMHYKYGGKTLYYFNTNDQAGEISVDQLEKLSYTDTTESEADCDSCTI